MEKCTMLCKKCGSADRVEVHHIQPKCNGGTDDPTNLTKLCRGCHLAEHRENGHLHCWAVKGGKARIRNLVGQLGHRGFLDYQREIGRKGARKGGRTRIARLRSELGEKGFRAYQRRIARGNIASRAS